MNSRKLDEQVAMGFARSRKISWHRICVSSKKKGNHLRVEVRFYGFVRDIVGASAASTLALEMPARSTLKELVHLLAEKFGEKFSERLLTATGELEPNVRVFVGDAQSPSLEEPLDGSGNSFAEVKVFVLSATAGG